MPMIYVYVMRSTSNALKLYVGQAADLEKRLKEHNSGKSKYTKAFMPWELIYSEAFENRVEARKREVYFKSTAGKNFLRKSDII